MQADVVIVGGGIGGGVLAALLARGGKRVVIIERNPEGSPAIVRPEVLWPATVEILFSLIPRGEWDDALVAVRGIEFARGHQALASIDAKTFQQAGVHPWSTDPNLTRAKLLARSDVHRGVEAVGLLRNGNRTVGVRARNVATGAEFAIHAEWTIGDDGAHSRVRADCGIAMETRRFPVEFFCFGFDWPATFPPATVRGFINPARSSAILSLAAIPLPNGKGAGLVPVSADRLEKSEDVRPGWNAFRTSHPSIAEVIGSRSFPDDFVHVRREWGHAPRYGAAGVLLMGDAVHPVSPAGGQGANMSIHDASVLGELLLEDHPRLLDEYERRRRSANERSVQISTRAARFFKLRERGGIRGRILALLPALLRRRWFAARILRRAATTFVGE